MSANPREIDDALSLLPGHPPVPIIPPPTFQLNLPRGISSRPKSLPLELPKVVDNSDTPGELNRVVKAVPSWLVSFIVHVVVIVSLALYGFSGKIYQSISLNAVAQSSLDLSEGVRVDFSELSAGSMSALDRTDEDLVTASKQELEQNAEASLRMESADTIFAGANDRMDGSEFVGVGGDSAAQQIVEMDANTKKRADAKANFFGVSARGNQFVYVVDCSGSMAGTRWLLTCRELMKSLRSLNKDSMFLVILYSGNSWAMFNTRPADTVLLPADKENVDKFERWLSQQFPIGPTFPMSAMNVALQVKPDAIFLLSDGEFQDDTVGFLQNNNVEQSDIKRKSQKIPIHTIAMDFTEGIIALRQIALENEGQFKMVDSNQ